MIWTTGAQVSLSRILEHASLKDFAIKCCISNIRFHDFALLSERHRRVRLAGCFDGILNSMARIMLQRFGSLWFRILIQIGCLTLPISLRALLRYPLREQRSPILAAPAGSPGSCALPSCRCWPSKLTMAIPRHVGEHAHVRRRPQKARLVNRVYTPGNSSCSLRGEPRCGTFGVLGGSGS